VQLVVDGLDVRAGVAADDDRVVGDRVVLSELEDVDVLGLDFVGEGGRCCGDLLGVDGGSPWVLRGSV